MSSATNKRKLEDEEAALEETVTLVQGVFPDVTKAEIEQVFTGCSRKPEITLEYFLEKRSRADAKVKEEHVEVKKEGEPKASVIDLVDDDEDKSLALALQMQEEFEQAAKRTKATPKSEDDDASYALALQLQSETEQQGSPKKQEKALATEEIKYSEDENGSLALALRMQEDMNRVVEKKAMYMIPLEHGVVLFKNCLDPDQQIGLYNQCLELAESPGNLYNNRGYGKFTTSNGCETGIGCAKTKSGGRRPGRKPAYNNRVLQVCTVQDRQTLPIVLLNVNWNQSAQKQSLPPDLETFAKNQFKKGQKNIEDNKKFYSKLPKEYHPPASFTPEALQAIFYPDNGKLSTHQDQQPGWVLSVSIGSSAMFSFSDQHQIVQFPTYSIGMKNPSSVKLESGDVVLFNGRKVWHSIDRIIEGTAPDFWGAELNDFGYSRFNLQFRDPSAPWQY